MRRPRDASEGRTDVEPDSRRACSGGLWMGDEHHIPHAIEAITLMADGLAQPALDAVPGHGIAHLSADGDAEPRAFFRPGKEDAEQDALSDLPPSALDSPVVPTEPDAVPLGQTETARARITLGRAGGHQ